MRLLNDDVYSRLGFGLGFVGALTLSASSVFGIPVPPCCGGRSVAVPALESLASDVRVLLGWARNSRMLERYRQSGAAAADPTSCLNLEHTPNGAIGRP